MEIVLAAQSFVGSAATIDRHIGSDIGVFSPPGTSDTVGDFLLTLFGDENITPIVDFFLNYTGGPLTDAAGAVDPSAFADLLSSF